jgi:DNA-binding NarL/FixJ family response regulator
MASVLNAQHDIKVVGEAGDGAEAVERVRMLRPNVVIMDLHMPVMDGVEATVKILEEMPDTQVIILTTFETDDYIFRGLQAGARSYLLKDSPSEGLIDAIRAVRRGEAPIEPRVATRLLERINHPPSETQGPDQLSEREVEVLELAAKGATNKEIGEQLFIAENTIKSHFHRIFDKLAVRDRTHAVAEAARQGIIKL